MDNTALAALACPHCGTHLLPDASSLFCESGHSFDLARQGYVNLLASGGRVDTADSPEMVAARERFLASGVYEDIAEAARIAAAPHADRTTDGVFVDVGAGTGWLLSRVLDACPERSGIAIDVSKYAARRAAQAHVRLVSVVANAWERLPLQPDSAAVLISFFAPRNPAEFRRVLAQNGIAIVISPGPDHLSGLVGPLSLLSVDEHKAQRLERSFGEHFDLASLATVNTQVALSREQCRDAVLMGPSSHHADPAGLEEALCGLSDPVVATISVELRTFVPRT